VLLWPAAAAVGIAAESIAFDWGEPRDWLPDLLAGWTLVACGLIALSRRPVSRSGALMAAAGFAWFAPNFATTDITALDWLSEQALYLHRGPLVHLVLTYPGGRTASATDRAAVAGGYVAAVFPAVWGSEAVAVVLSVAMGAVAGRGYIRAVGRARRMRLAALQATGFLLLVFAGTALARLAFPTQEVTDATLLVYEAALCGLALVLLAGLISEPWLRAEITDLVVDLDATRSGSLRDALAAALGDPTLEVGFWIGQGYVDTEGRPLVMPEGSERGITPVERDGQPIALLVHDPAVLDDPGLADALARAARLAASNAQLQAEVLVQLEEIAASRRRLVHAGDEERRRLDLRLRGTVERRLTELAETLRSARGDGAGDERIGLAEERLARTLDDVRDLARGLHPRGLEAGGLRSALATLAARSPIPVELRVEDVRPPGEIETAAYFVCSEALANVIKSSRASRATISARKSGDRMEVTIDDDGVGGADPARGTGLRGLADRVEALGGALAIESPTGRGTRVVASLPLKRVAG
jgi:signal transduction histidine kinase